MLSSSPVYYIPSGFLKLVSLRSRIHRFVLQSIFISFSRSPFYVCANLSIYQGVIVCKYNVIALTRFCLFEFYLLLVETQHGLGDVILTFSFLIHVFE